MSKIPMSCQDVKCMQAGCINQAMHKVGEENIFSEDSETEEYYDFNMIHNLTTYLCEDHFNLLMKRDEFYGDISKLSCPDCGWPNNGHGGVHPIKGVNTDMSGNPVELRPTGKGATLLAKALAAIQFKSNFSKLDKEIVEEISSYLSTPQTPSL